MLNPDLIPTRLIEEEEKPPIIIETPLKPSRWRLLYLGWVFLRFFMGILVLFLRRRMTGRTFGRRLRREFEKLGGLWIKFGQLLSLRSDVFPREFCVELARLQDQVAGFPAEQARQIIKEELGAPVEVLFEPFEDKPFAAASVGQIHRARLRSEGVWVA